VVRREPGRGRDTPRHLDRTPSGEEEGFQPLADWATSTPWSSDQGVVVGGSLLPRFGYVIPMSRARRRADRIRAEIPIQRVLSDYGYEVDGGYDGEQQFSCDLHGDGVDIKPSARVYPDSGSWYCFSCDATRDAIQTVRDKEGIEFFPALRKIEERYRLPTMPFEEGDYDTTKGAAHGASKEVAGLLDPSKTFEDDQKRAHTLLDGVTVDKDLPMLDTLKLWEAFDKICFVVRKETLSEANGRIALAKIRKRTIEKIKESARE